MLARRIFALCLVLSAVLAASTTAWAWPWSSKKDPYPGCDIKGKNLDPEYLEPYRNLDCVKKLFDNGKRDVNMRFGKFQITPLMAASIAASADLIALDSIRYLIAKGARVNEQSPGGDNVLTLLCLFGRSSSNSSYSNAATAFEFFLNQGANPDIKNKVGKTVVQICAEQGAYEHISKLINHVKKATCDSNKMTLLHYLVAIEDEVAVAKALNSGLFDADIRCKKGNPPLVFAVLTKKRKIAKQLVSQFGAKVNKDNPLSARAIHAAAALDDVDMLDFLKIAGAEINVHTLTKLKQHPLHIAAQNGAENAVKWLISNGGDVFAKDGNGFTPRQTAELAKSTVTTQKSKAQDPLNPFGGSSEGKTQDAENFDRIIAMLKAAELAKVPAATPVLVPTTTDPETQPAPQTETTEPAAPKS